MFHNLRGHRPGAPTWERPAEAANPGRWPALALMTGRDPVRLSGSAPTGPPGPPPEHTAGTTGRHSLPTAWDIYPHRTVAQDLSPRVTLPGFSAVIGKCPDSHPREASCHHGAHFVSHTLHLPSSLSRMGSPGRPGHTAGYSEGGHGLWPSPDPTKVTQFRRGARAGPGEEAERLLRAQPLLCPEAPRWPA